MQTSLQILLAIIQAATEFLPISSSGHLALISNLISKPDLFFFTVLHLASLLAVIIFTRKEIYNLITLDKKYKKLWLYLIIATIPSALVGYFFNRFIESTFSSLFFIGFAFIFTGFILLLTKFASTHSKFNFKNSLLIGIFQTLALFPGVSRSAMTISSGMFAGIEKQKAARFSFLLFIPLALGAFILELPSTFQITTGLAISFLVCLIFSLLFLNLLVRIIKTGKFWLFSIYCFVIGIIIIISQILL